MNRFYLLALLTLTCLWRTSPGAELPDAVRTFIKKHCIECHNGDAKQGGLDLSNLQTNLEEAATFARWMKIHDRVKAGEMPPPKESAVPRPQDRDGMVKGIFGLLSNFERDRLRQEGRVPLRRLNRSEYENTMRDLFALPGLQVKDRLPEDGLFDGFDKASTALEFSAVQMRKYMEAADFVLDQAIAHQAMPLRWKQHFRRIGGLSQFGESTFPINNGQPDIALVREINRQGPDGKKMHLNDRVPLLASMQSLGILTHARPSFIPEIENFSPFHSGFYRLQTSLWSFDMSKGEALPAQRMQSFVLTASGRVLAHFDAPSLKPQLHELVVWLNAGETLELNPANLWGNYSNPLGYEGPCVAVDYVDIEGPLHETWPPESHRRLFGNLPIVEIPVKKGISSLDSYPRQPEVVRRPPGARPHHKDGDEFNKWQPVWTAAASRPTEDCERLLKDFLPRAFRRPVPAEEVAVYVQIARERIAAGDFFETAMRAAYRVALCSPDFLFHQEPAGVQSAVDRMALESFSLASRLSYFLWNSMPDDELLEVAKARKLGGKELKNQVERMLKDRKSDRFVEDFLDQWIELRKINFTSPETKIYPEFRPDLRDAMLAESRAYFREMLDKDLGAAHVVDSDFVMINQRLAEHYGIPGVEGSAIRRVPKPEESPRGGILTQGAVLKVTANGTTTSPVLRGAWVMNRLIGQPPQPPPPDVPAVDPDVRGTTTIREQLNAHRNNIACAGCHAKFDPAGFALESFDVIGGWRTQYRFAGEPVMEPDERLGNDPPPELFLGVGRDQWRHVVNNVRFGLPVDASGETADGRKFKDIYEFKQILLSQEEMLARNLIERLVLYSTGVPVGFTDRSQVDQILERSRDSRFGLRTIIDQLIANQVFFHRK